MGQATSGGGLDAASATAIYAAVVATGTLAWQIVSERKKTRPDVHVSAVWLPPVVDPDFDNQPGYVRATVRATHPVTVVATGTAALGRLWKWRRTEIDGAARTRGQQISGSLPVTVTPDTPGLITATRERLSAADVSLEKPCLWWVKTSTGHVYRSDPFTVS